MHMNFLERLIKIISRELYTIRISKNWKEKRLIPELIIPTSAVTLISFSQCHISWRVTSTFFSCYFFAKANYQKEGGKSLAARPKKKSEGFFTLNHSYPVPLWAQSFFFHFNLIRVKGYIDRKTVTAKAAPWKTGFSYARDKMEDISIQSFSRSLVSRVAF